MSESSARASLVASGLASASSVASSVVWSEATVNLANGDRQQPLVRLLRVAQLAPDLERGREGVLHDVLRIRGAAQESAHRRPHRRYVAPIERLFCPLVSTRHARGQVQRRDGRGGREGHGFCGSGPSLAL
jgi:hypothetical protein